MKVGDVVRLSLGDYGEPLGRITELLPNERCQVQLRHGGTLIAPLGMLIPTTPQRAQRTRY